MLFLDVDWDLTLTVSTYYYTTTVFTYYYITTAVDSYRPTPTLLAEETDLEEHTFWADTVESEVHCFLLIS